MCRSVRATYLPEITTTVSQIPLENAAESPLDNSIKHPPGSDNPFEHATEK